ncbi:hypothetical protein Vretifemale_7267 [Volvox reticuliferus]|nr:hypothetical protein Vretifemale_7267 [Volvox reticuliferus]
MTSRGAIVVVVVVVVVMVQRANDTAPCTPTPPHRRTVHRGVGGICTLLLPPLFRKKDIPTVESSAGLRLLLFQPALPCPAGRSPLSTDGSIITPLLTCSRVF